MGSGAAFLAGCDSIRAISAEGVLAWSAGIVSQSVTNLAFSAFVFGTAVQATVETGAFDDGGWGDDHIGRGGGLAIRDSWASASAAVADAVSARTDIAFDLQELSGTGTAVDA